MESSGKGAAFFSPRWEGRSGLQEATGARQLAPAAQVRHHAEELLRSVDPLVPACAGNRYPPHPSKWAQHCNCFCFDGRAAGGSLQCKKHLLRLVHSTNGKGSHTRFGAALSCSRPAFLGKVCRWESPPLCKWWGDNEYQNSAC